MGGLPVVASAISSFAGGTFAALIGPLPALIMSGFFIVIGSAIIMAGGDATFLNVVGLGPFFGPHISWAAGLAALAYAGRRGFLHGQQITIPLIKFKRIDQIAIGGLFGLAGYFINLGLATLLGNHGNSLACTVFIVCIAARLIFGRTGPFGKPEGPKKTLPCTQTLALNILIGLVFGFLNGYVALLTGQAVLGFGIALAALIFLQAGADDCPILHNVALIAATSALATQNLYIAAVFGAITILLEEVLHNLFINDGDTFIDTWATSIAIMSFFVALL
ncbi:MAG: hypothetical protein K6U04_06905 [Armatimonadetes bacterium]|nr:hypothetical protein [Armatimonadota bacterium]